MTSFSVTFSNVLLALLYMLPGFVLCKLKKVRPAHLSTTSVLLLYVCSPCMFIDALIRPDLSPDLPGKMGLFILISLRRPYIHRVNPVINSIPDRIQNVKKVLQTYNESNK